MAKITHIDLVIVRMRRLGGRGFSDGWFRINSWKEREGIAL